MTDPRDVAGPALGSKPARWGQVVVLLVALAVAGCGSAGPPTAPWEQGPAGGRVVVTPRYRLHTTVTDDRFVRDLAGEMEAAHRMYRRLAKPGKTDAGPLVGYVFGRREEWEAFTRENTGPLSAIYLKIHHGGYAHETMFATFFHGADPTLAAVRHEGWHQYVATTFVNKPPPFLEEGVATLFETEWDEASALPVTNFGRLTKLHQAIRLRRAWPLGELLNMHAGHVVVGQTHREIDTFYAQAWALAMYCLDEGRLDDLLAGYATGAFPSGPGNARLAMERAFGKSFDEIEQGYQRFVVRVVGLAPEPAVATATESR